MQRKFIQTELLFVVCQLAPLYVSLPSLFTYKT